jgi:hypothetical protein
MRRCATLILLALVGCTPAARDTTAGVVDDQEPACPPDLPPPSDPCLAGQCGNDRGVGRPCTRGGGQCDVFNLLGGEAGICIVDFADNTAVHACSMPCTTDDECGAGAICAVDPADPSRRGCSLLGCEGR